MERRFLQLSALSSGGRLKPFDPSGAFQESVDASNVRRLAARGAGMTLFSGGLGLVIQVIATAVLARLLTPRDFGVVTMVTTFSLLLANVGLNGMTEAIVQRARINRDQASNLFWINVGIGLLLTVGFALAGQLLVWFYKEPRVKFLTIGLSLTILLTSVAVLHLALLKRAMRFADISINDIRARVISVAVSIVLGWMGWGYWALAAGAVVLPLSVLIGAWSLCRWIPSWPRKAEGTGSMLRFALNTYGNFSVNYFSRNTDNLLVGWRFDARSLGYYKKAYDLFALSATQFVTSITVVVVSALSRVNKDREQYRRYLLGCITVMVAVGMFLSADLTLVGGDLIRLLLGPRWEPAGRIFTFFGPGIGAMMLYYTHGWIHLSIGRADRWLRWGIFEFAVTFLLFLAGLRWGPVGIAIAWTVSFWILAAPALWYAGRPIGFQVRLILAVVWKYVLAALLAGSACALIMREVPFLVQGAGASGALARIFFASSVTATLYLGGVVLLHGGLAPLRQIVTLLREMAPSRFSRFMQIPNAPGESGLAASCNAPPKPPIDKVPLVSILIPAYNAEEWIADTIRSAVAQTWPHKEIIVVDDGSKDRTLAIAREFEETGVIVVSQKNQGASAARNKAFSLSRGGYIQWLDADDLLDPEKIARQMELVKHGVGKMTILSSAWGYFMYRPRRAQFIPTALWCDLSPVEWLLRKMGQNLYMQTACWLVSRELTEAAGPWDTRLLTDDDGEYFCRVLLASDGVRFVQDAKVYYRAFQFNSLSHIERFPKRIEAQWLSMQLHMKYLRLLEDSPRVHRVCVEYMRCSLIYFYPERPDIVAQAEKMAMEFERQLGVPTLSWKYSWVEKLFGWSPAKLVQRLSRVLRWSIEKRWDQVLYLVESRQRAAVQHQPGGRSQINGSASQLSVKEPDVF